MIARPLALSFAAALLAGTALAQPVDMTVEVGASQTLATKGRIDKVVVDKAGVVSTAAASARQLKLTGVAPGRTLVTLNAGKESAEYDVRVVEAGSGEANALRRRITARPGLENVKVEKAGDTLILSGSVSDLASHARAVGIAQSLAGDAYNDQIRVMDDRMVAVDIQFVAVSDVTLKALGVNLMKFGQTDNQIGVVAPNTVQGFDLPRSGGLDIGTAAPIQSAFNFFLTNRAEGITGVVSALSQVGLSQVLAQPTLLVRSGEQAEFLAGGEIPIPVPQAGSAAGAITIDYRPYGVRLNVAPTVLSGDRIVLKLSPEVSELDYGNRISIQGFDIPALRRRTTSTTVELGDGESYVIAGLTFSSTTVNDSRFPGIGDLPVIGALFKRAQNTQEKQELIIIATPRLVRPLPRAELDVASQVTPRTPSFGEILLNVPNGVASRGFGLTR